MACGFWLVVQSRVMTTVLCEQTSIVNHYLRELRDIDIQKNQEHFERNLERLGIIAGYEFSKQLSYQDHQTTTPLGTVNTPILKDKIVLATILRAGLPVQKGVKSIFDDAELSFIAAGRKPETSAGVEIDLAYTASPRLEGKVLVIADTMLATGKSLVDTYEALTRSYGQPQQVYIIAVIASRQGIKYVEQNISGVNIIVSAVDPELNDQFFIVPGLGDAGDLLYGPKAQKNPQVEA
jgi:uracil phosphoribosyltransferase